MNQPILKISIASSGMLKVEASIEVDEDRPDVFDFYGRVLPDIKALDVAIREKGKKL